LKVELFDSGTFTTAQGFMALAAAWAAIDGKDILEVIEAANDMKSRVKQFFVLDTFSYQDQITNCEKSR
jgi:fatty acid-binding protein DegV